MATGCHATVKTIIDQMTEDNQSCWTFTIGDRIRRIQCSVSGFGWLRYLQATTDCNAMRQKKHTCTKAEEVEVGQSRLHFLALKFIYP